jgi:hypothetical protein
MKEVSFAAFVLCGKNSDSNDYEVHELSWSPEFSHLSWSNKELIGLGTGYKRYLEDYLVKNNQPSWGTISLDQAKKELKGLFLVAVDKKRCLQGEEFSDDYNVDYIS